MLFCFWQPSRDNLNWYIFPLPIVMKGLLIFVLAIFLAFDPVLLHKITALSGGYFIGANRETKFCSQNFSARTMTFAAVAFAFLANVLSFACRQQTTF